MKSLAWISLFLSLVPISVTTVSAQDQPVLLEFSGDTLEENGVTVTGAGFGSYPIAAVFFGSVPTGDTFAEATDGHGAIVAASPGQGVMIFGPTIETSNAALIRCSIQTDAPHASVVMATIGQGPDVFVGTNTPNNGAFFENQYRRLSLFCIPPSTGFQPLVQIVNTSETEILTVFVDNFEIIPLDPEKYYSAKFLDGDENDPDVISVDSGGAITPTPTIVQDPNATPLPTATPAIASSTGELHIANLSWNYLPPYLLDFDFSLRDENGEAVNSDPSQFGITCMEDGNPVNLSETGARLTRAANKPLKCMLVLDYTLGMADPQVNGDANGDGVSDSIEAMEQAAKDFIDGLNDDAQVGITVYHRDEAPLRVIGFMQNKDYLKSIIDTILDEQVQWRFGVSRAWDAADVAVQEFGSVSNPEERIVAFISNGRDDTSTKQPAGIIQSALDNQVKVYSIGYGTILDPSALQNIANQTLGRYGTAETTSHIATQFKQIADELDGRYTLRWATLKRDSTFFTPSFTLSLEESEATYIGEEAYASSVYADDPMQGVLRVIGSETVEGRTVVFLRSDYTPQWIRHIHLHVNATVPYTVERVPEQQGGLCEGWNLTMTDAEIGGTWIDLESTNPKNPFTSIPFTAFGSLLKFEFRNVTESIDVLSCGWSVDNEIYAELDGQTFELIRSDSLDPIPTCTPTPTHSPTPSFTPTPTLTPSPTHTPTPWPTPESRLLRVDLPNLSADRIPFDFIWIPQGTFMMGSQTSEEDRDSNETLHDVTITQPYYIGQYEVTQAHWKAVMNENPSNYIDPANPVENVSWIQCQEFITRLNDLGLGTFRLPTEAEWEYACRAGTEIRFYWGDDPSYLSIDLFAWSIVNTDQSQNAGLKIPNPWDLFDMAGNVSEWCQDWYDPYPSVPQIDPIGPETGNSKVIRGGGWNSTNNLLRSASRGKASPDRRSYALGLRLVLEVE